MDEVTFHRLFDDKAKLRKSSTVLRSYQTDANPSAPIRMEGKIEALVESNTRSMIATFHVIKGNTNPEPLLGSQTAEILGLVAVANAVQMENESTLSGLLEDYADLFQGIGKMEVVQVYLHVDETVTPVAQLHRKISFSVRPKFEVELEKLAKEDVIEKVEKPVSWVSPVVITPKPASYEIQLNVDNTHASQFRDLLESVGLSPYINGPTYRSGHTLDLLIDRQNDQMLSDFKIVSSMPSDHYAVICSVGFQDQNQRGKLSSKDNAGR